MTEFGFTYRSDYSGDHGLFISDVSRPLMPTINSKNLQIPDRNGAFYQGYQYDPLEIPVDLWFKGTDLASLQAVRRDLAQWLNPDQGVADLIFDDEPDKKYQAVLKDKSKLDQVIRFSQGSITFLAPDPYAYAVNDDVFTYSAPGSYNFSRKGTANSNPLMEIQGTSTSSDSIQINLNDNTITFTGDLQTGETFTLDSDLLTAKVKKTDGSIVSAVNDIDQLDFPIAIPGVNQLTVTTTGSATVKSIKISCRSRWI